MAIFLPIFLLVLGTIGTAYLSANRSRRLTLQENVKTSVLMGRRVILDTLAPVVADLRYLSREVAESGLLDAAVPPGAAGYLESLFNNFSTAHGITINCG